MLVVQNDPMKKRLADAVDLDALIELPFLSAAQVESSDKLERVRVEIKLISLFNLLSITFPSSLPVHLCCLVLLFPIPTQFTWIPFSLVRLHKSDENRGN